MKLGSNLKLAAIIAGVYVSCATIFSFVAMDMHIYDGVLYYFFSPAAFTPMLIIWGEAEPAFYILFTQLFTWVVFTFLVYGFVIAFRKVKRN